MAAREVLTLESLVGARKRATRAINACISAMAAHAAARTSANARVSGLSLRLANGNPATLSLQSLYRRLSSHDLSKRLHKFMDCMDCVLHVCF
jgi:hypothetical protein